MSKVIAVGCTPAELIPDPTELIPDPVQSSLAVTPCVLPCARIYACT